MRIISTETKPFLTHLKICFESIEKFCCLSFSWVGFFLVVDNPQYHRIIGLPNSFFCTWCLHHWSRGDWGTTVAQQRTHVSHVNITCQTVTEHLPPAYLVSV